MRAKCREWTALRQFIFLCQGVLPWMLDYLCGIKLSGLNLTQKMDADVDMIVF